MEGMQRYAIYLHRSQEVSKVYKRYRIRERFRDIRPCFALKLNWDIRKWCYWVNASRTVDWLVKRYKALLLQEQFSRFKSQWYFPLQSKWVFSALTLSWSSALNVSIWLRSFGLRCLSITINIQVKRQWAVALLVERSLPTPEIRGSNPVIRKICIDHLFTVTCVFIEKKKIKKRGQGMDRFLKKALNGHPVFCAKEEHGYLSRCFKENRSRLQREREKRFGKPF